MFLTVLFIKLLLVHYATQSQVKVQACCGHKVSLKCPNVDFDTMDFVSMGWYKLNKENKDGIIRRSKGDKSGQHYNFPRNASLDNKYNLLLSNVTPEDSGTYECFIGANVGGQNRYLQVNLTVQVCVTSQAPLTTLTTMTPDNTTESALACSKQAEDLPVLWTVSGCVAVGLGKIILCLISIWVFQIICSSRQQREW
uniref:Ig-like domain-containing protein n=1 Tax=Monopterus albus TaxID=43700 RepID=A0A3Q3JIJ0_MONAL